METDYCPHADRAADCAVKKVFAILGVDVDKPSEVNKFRRGVQVGQKINEAVDRSIMVAVTGIAMGILYAIWQGIKHFVKIGG